MFSPSRHSVTLCTSKFSINNSTFHPQFAFTYFVWFSKQTAVSPLFSVNSFVLLTEKD